MTTSSPWDRLAPKWDAMLADASSPLNREEAFRRFHWFLKRVVRPGNRTKTCRLLDLACGTGEAAWPLWKRVASVTFFDRSPVMLRLARNKHPKGIFVRGDAVDLPFLEAEFDIVVSRGLLLSRLGPEGAEACLRHVLRSMRPQGLFLCDFATRLDPPNQGDDMPSPIAAWTRETMSALVARVGAAVVAWDGTERHAVNRALIRKA